MKDDNKTKKQFIHELSELRSQNAKLKKSITMSMSAELAVEEARRYAENIVETVREPLLILDADLKIISANRNFFRTFKVTPGETIGSFIYDLGNKQWDIPKLQKLLEEVLPEKQAFDDFEVVHNFQDIGQKIMLLNARKIYQKDIGVNMILLAIEDITERKNAEEMLKERAQQLKDANEELESFSYSVSHDLKAPLRSIDGYTGMLIKKYGSTLDEDAARMINVISSKTKMMGVLIDDLLSFSKALRSSMSMSEIDMDKLSREVWNNIRVANSERELVVKITKLLPGFGDRALVRQVLFNLFSNAVKFTKDRKPGIISMNSYSEFDKIVYRLKDNGAGFDMVYYDKLFGVFQRLHSYEEYEGTGVGLSIVQRIVKRHGGRVWAEGEVDKGATFYFSLPHGKK